VKRKNASLGEVDLFLYLGAGALIVYYINKSGILSTLANTAQQLWPQGVSIVPIPPGTTAPVQPGVTGGTTPMGVPFAVASGSGALTVYAGGVDSPPSMYNLQASVGPTGQSVQQLLDSGWSYMDIAEMIAMSQ